MNTTTTFRLLFTALFVGGLLVAPMQAGTIFSENFNGITAPPGNFNGAPAGQVTTTHDLVFGASLVGWSKGGTSTIHAVDTANTWTGGAVTEISQNWGVMIWQNNVITQDNAIAGSNDNGTEYQIDFLGAGAVYENAGQVNNGTTDNIQIEVLRASDNAVLQTFNQIVAPPVGVGDLGLTAYSFNYTGDGSGDIKFRIGPGNANQGRFQGTIDDLTLSLATGLIGDFDGDGDVDGVDLAEMFSNFNGPGGGVPTNPATDLDGDGDVDGVDIATLFGAFTGPKAPARVPESAGLALLILGGLSALRLRRD